MATLMFVCTFAERVLPSRVWDSLESYFYKIVHSLFGFLFTDVTITFEEYQSDESFHGRNEAYTAIENYLSIDSSERASKLKAKTTKGMRSIAFSMDDYEVITDEFEGIKVKWYLEKQLPVSQSISWDVSRDEGRRCYKLMFKDKYRSIITESYIPYVIEEGKKIKKRNKFQKLYTNCNGDDRDLWTYVTFQHPATFDAIAMEPNKKQEIINDLMAFTKSKEYYNKIGKAWKRGYLLYGPPGTGKSSVIAAMANLLHYDVYDLELTAVQDNTSLRKLLIDTSKKSIIVIEDIDCSLDLTGQRKNQSKDDENKDSKVLPIKEMAKGTRDKKKSKSEVTLSGLLNFIDGLWSACGEERIILFTTNHVDKLDPALIRRGRMDKHIELSYCGFEAFKVLAKNYLNLESHNLFEKIRTLLEETRMTPADVAENLMPKSPGLENAGEVGLENLILAMEKAKEVERLKAEEALKEDGDNGELDEEESDEEDDEEDGSEGEGTSDEDEDDDSSDEDFLKI
ncbi:hypothetical protein ACH5RR_033227 [Cinchona calisaya]|uniref:AAA+ ATPase domain-containing protein n=1 Tax=Cinchona calisaya TaxID=153742 RepID=A0ABD2YKD1_9GENT